MRAKSTIVALMTIAATLFGAIASAPAQLTGKTVRIGVLTDEFEHLLRRRRSRLR